MTRATHLALLAVQLLFASLSVAGKIALVELAPSALVMLRAGAAALVLFGWHLLAGPPVARRDLPRLALYGILGVTLNQLLFITGLRYTTATNATVLGTAIPVFTLGVALLLGREPFGWRRVLGIALALGGALTLVGAERFTLAGRGNVLILLNALSYACFLVLARDLVARYTARAVMAWVFLFGALGVATVGAPALAQAPLSALQGRTWLAVGYIILGPTLGAYILNTWALARASSSTVALYVYLQPVMTAALAWPLLGERPALRQVLAAALICGGIYVATAAPVSFSRPRRAAAPPP